MSKPFLTAEWRNLLMANYAIDPAILKGNLPCRTEPDDFNGTHYVSLVGFLFSDTKVLGLSFPFHQTFEEVNLRFYVRYKEDFEWKRGVVFIKEIVPRRMISFIANTVYKENYATHPMKHSWETVNDEFHVAYERKAGKEWSHLRAIAEKDTTKIKEGSEAEFITEHYWGYTSIRGSCTGVYQVVHPKWKIHPVKSYSIKCESEKLYGARFVDTLAARPVSVFLAAGSTIQVMKGSKIFAL